MRKKIPDAELSIQFDDLEVLREVIGHRNTHLAFIEKYFPIKIYHRGNFLKLSGEEPVVDTVHKVIKEMIKTIEKGRELTIREIEFLCKNLKANDINIEELMEDVILITPRRKPITPKNLTQKLYVDAMRRNDIVFSIGPAGTGKTYLAVAVGVAHLMNQDVQRIILTRPAVEAGEKLGFLPGGLAEKVDPYLRPLYDALYDMLDYEKVTRFIEKGIIEIAPIAFMRGRTLNDSFIIMDEAQNTTSDQMKMFLTRLGFNSKAVITGDITQIDLPKGQVSGLVEVQDVLKNIKGIDFVYFTEKDVVRHPLVQDVIRAYENYLKLREGK
ncbi:MAG: PhoH family protein [Proteobacteria bacterium]|nr:PhoH family protein [Pseudomonadota bacterium]